ncbi:hypothetical protein HMPREF0063_11624 [Aeromicrobium marinum DSM 15272]|uniref:Uncharacterized protein n=1 Tax=Aeromicrobium marinum DSM 15272 TaxID=585531 RepID=E2SC65_9ACTN|nr:hypothetical protein [Aeromicrobium marinum]EFQ83351.1 hypothetical protein HMPREF0063_11624 [Aeromicrobium marinum DSM 15272]
MKFNRSTTNHDHATTETAPAASGSHPPEHAAGRHEPTHGERLVLTDRAQRERFGGAQVGAGFFGWLTGIGVAAILVGIVAAVSAAVGDAMEVTEDELLGRSADIGVAAAIILVVLVMISYAAGGYVAGRMSRFDGARQGLTVWIISLVVIAIAAALGAVFGSEYDVLARVDVPEVPLTTDELSWGAGITAAAALVGGLLAALGGGKAGTHYHRRIDRV